MVPEINLLPQIERRKSSKLLFIVSGILIGLLLVFLCFQFFTLKKEIKSLESEEIQLVGERDLLSAEVSTLDNVDQGNHSSSVAFIESVSYPVSPLIDEIYSLVEVNSYLRTYLFDETGILLTVDFETMTDVSSFIERLLNSSYFSDIKVETLTSFEPVDEQDTEVENEVKFDVQWRYTATIQLDINETYLSEGGPVNE
ncbi:PilN domain-containing protein [Psychrobacillus psychrotolerans]|uniref:PilN domain-containing protein n=1 Tax=Psychrobacillus psychrotolerans TaxID=126156 RepID=UPI003B013AA6